MKGGVYLSNNSNMVTPNFNVYSERINSIIKSSIPVIDTSAYMNPLIESIQASLNILTESINSSIQPLIEHMNEINNEMIASINSAVANIALNSLNNLKIMSNYSSDTIESIDKSVFSNTIDDVYTSIDNFEYYTDSTDDLDECKSSLLDLKQNIQESSLTKESFYNFLSLLISLFALIQPYFDNSSETIIDNQKAIIELQKEQLEVTKDIHDTFKNTQNISSNTEVIIENINNSLNTLIKSIEE